MIDHKNDQLCLPTFVHAPCLSASCFLTMQLSAGVIHCKKGYRFFPVPSRDVTNQTHRAGKLLNYSRPRRIWLVTSRLRTEKTITFVLQCIDSPNKTWTKKFALLQVYCAERKAFLHCYECNWIKIPKNESPALPVAFYHRTAWENLLPFLSTMRCRQTNADDVTKYGYKKHQNRIRRWTYK